MPRGRRVGIVGDGGGHVALAADLAAACRLDVTALTDLAGAGEQDLFNYARAVQSQVESGEVDAVLLTGYFGGYGVESEIEVARTLAATADSSQVPVVIQTMYPESPTSVAVRSMQVPVYADISAAVRVLSRLDGWTAEIPSGIPNLPNPVARRPLHEGYFEARELLAGAGIPFVEAHKVRTMDAALAAAAELGFPVALKALVASHKSDAGGVRLGITDERDLEVVFAEMTSSLQPSAFSVERVAPVRDGVELLVGARRDRRFGPVVAIGLGGLYTEVLRDVVVALAPVTPEQAERMIRSLRGASLLLGARGGRLLNVAAAARAAARVSELAALRPDIAEIEINPLLVRSDGVLGLDARVAATITR